MKSATLSHCARSSSEVHVSTKMGVSDPGYNLITSIITAESGEDAAWARPGRNRGWHCWINATEHAATCGSSKGKSFESIASA